MEEKKQIEGTKRKKERKVHVGFFKSITTNRSVGMLIFRSIMMLVVPYIYLFICGIIDSLLIRRGFAYREAFILFVFFTLMAAWIFAVVLIVISIKRFVTTPRIKQEKQPQKKKEKKPIDMRAVEIAADLPPVDVQVVEGDKNE